MKCGDDEIRVYSDNDFEILRYTADKSKTGYGYEVIPIDHIGNRLDDMEICPEPDNLDDAIILMEKHRSEIKLYKEEKRKVFLSGDDV